MATPTAIAASSAASNFIFRPSNWSDAGGIATVIGIVFAIVTAYAAIQQLRELVRTRKLDALLHVFNEMSSEAARLDRRLIYERHTERPDDIDPAMHRVVERTVVAFDRIGTLLRLKLIPQEELFERHSEHIFKSWMALEKHIDHRRKTLNDQHAADFIWLAKEVNKYYDSNPSLPRPKLVSEFHNRLAKSVASDA